MKAQIKIPKGWRRLKVGEFNQPGDMFLNHRGEWQPTTFAKYAINAHHNPHITYEGREP